MALETEARKHLRLLLHDVILTSGRFRSSVGWRRVDGKIVVVFSEGLVLASQERLRLLSGLGGLRTFLRIGLPLPVEAKTLQLIGVSVLVIMTDRIHGLSLPLELFVGGSRQRPTLAHPDGSSSTSSLNTSGWRLSGHGHRAFLGLFLLGEGGLLLHFHHLLLLLLLVIELLLNKVLLMQILLMRLHVEHHTVGTFLLLFLDLIQLVLRVEDLLAAVIEVLFALDFFLILFVSVLLLLIVDILFASLDVYLAIILGLLHHLLLFLHGVDYLTIFINVLHNNLI